jgi:lysozyme
MPRVRRRASILRKADPNVGAGLSVVGQGLSDVGFKLVDKGMKERVAERERQASIALFEKNQPGLELIETDQAQRKSFDKQSKEKSERDENIRLFEQNQVLNELQIDSALEREVYLKGKEKTDKINGKIGVSTARMEEDIREAEYGSQANLDYMQENGLLDDAVETFRDIRDEQIEHYRETMTPDDFSSFMSNSVQPYRFSLSRLKSNVDRRKGEMSEKALKDSISVQASTMTPDNIDDVYSNLLSSTAGFANIDGYDGFMRTATRSSIFDLVNDPATVDQHQAIRDSKAWNQFMTQSETNLSVAADIRRAASIENQLALDGQRFVSSNRAEIMQYLDNGANLQDIESIFRDKATPEKDIKAVVDSLKASIPKGDVFNEQGKTLGQKLRESETNKSVASHREGAGSLISEIGSMTVDRRTTKLYSERVSKTLKMIDAHHRAITLKANKLSPNAAINEKYANQDMISKLEEAINKQTKDMHGNAISKDDDDRNISRGLGLMAHNILFGADGEAIDNIAEKQAVANRLKMEAVRLSESGESIYADSPEKMREILDKIQEDIVRDIATNPDAYDIMISERSRSTFTIDSKAASGIVRDNIINDTEPRNKSIQEFIDLGMTVEGAESLYNSVAPSQFTERARIDNRSELEADLEDFATTPRIEAVDTATPDVSVNEPVSDQSFSEETMDAEESDSDLSETLLEAEGFRTDVYEDTEGNLTVGIGHLLTPEDKKTLKFGDEISEEQVQQWFREDQLSAKLNAKSVVNDFNSLPDDAQTVFESMAFQMGRGGLGKFKKTLRLADQRPFTAEVANKVADEMLNSKWARQTPERANKMAELMRNSVN